MDEIVSNSSMRLAPKFDLKLVQRCVVGRVFELGWTSERFEEFDLHLTGSGREPAKADRLGKKYQWIAYHEMLSFMADHHQYTSDRPFSELGTAYQGSWQDSVRDIDPSNVLLVPTYAEDATRSPSAFWFQAGIRDWHSSVEAKP